MAKNRILVNAPANGLNALLPDNMLDPRDSAEGSQNVLYERNVIRNTYGFTTLDLDAGINGDEPIIAIFEYIELDGSAHTLAMTQTRIYEHNPNTRAWADLTKADELFSADLDTPVSAIGITHNGNAITLNDSGGTTAYNHLIVSDGGRSDVKRWAGKYETTFRTLRGNTDEDAATYNHHRCLQVAGYYGRLIQLSPKSMVNGIWSENPQRIAWPPLGTSGGGCLEWYDTAGSSPAWLMGQQRGEGFVDMIDTGDTNVWSAPLGSQYIIYQRHSIWELVYVGGTTVFNPRPVIFDLGLLAPHLLYSYNNVHYFVGNDYNVYSYYGGSVKQSIGDKIQDYLRDDFTYEYERRAWIAMDMQAKRLWIFIAPDGDAYLTKAYGYDLKTGAWMVRDFSNRYTTTSGITAATLIGAQTYVIGDTFRTQLLTDSSFIGSGCAAMSMRYGDNLLDTSRSGAVEISGATWKNGGTDASLAGGNWNNEITTGDIMLVCNTKDITGIERGSHFYTIYDVSTNGFSVRPRYGMDATGDKYIEFSTGGPYELRETDIICGTTTGTTAYVGQICITGGDWSSSTAQGKIYVTGLSADFSSTKEWLNATNGSHVAYCCGSQVLRGLVGLADTSANNPASGDVRDWTFTGDITADITFAAVKFFNPDGQTFAQLAKYVKTDQQLCLGDSRGLVYVADETYTTDNGSAITGVHYTPVFDVGEPDIFKRFGAIEFNAIGDAILVEYQIDDGGWNTL